MNALLDRFSRALDPAVVLIVVLLLALHDVVLVLLAIHIGNQLFDERTIDYASILAFVLFSIVAWDALYRKNGSRFAPDL